MEGGDFFAAGEDLALVGIGLRSNIEACQQLMDRDMLGCQRFAVVHDLYDQHQVRSSPAGHCSCQPDQKLACLMMDPQVDFVTVFSAPT